MIRHATIPQAERTNANTFVNTDPAGGIKPNLEEAQHFLDLLGPDEDFTFQTFGDVDRNSQLARVFHGRLDQHANVLIDINRRGGGVFVMVNEGDGEQRAGGSSCRTTANVVRVRALFVDLDGSPIEPVHESMPPPSIIVGSSPGRYHAYWLVKGVKLDDFTRLQLKLAHKFDGDMKVCDLPRVLRLPGFFHQKAEPFMTRVIQPNRELQ